MKRITAPLRSSLSLAAHYVRACSPLWAAALVALCWMQPAIVDAAPSEDDIKKVVKLSSSAAVAYDKGEFNKALVLYRKAHSLWANPKLSFAIAKTLEAQGKYKEALAAAQRGLRENPKAVLKARLTSKIAYLKQQLSKGRLTLLITPSGATISIDGKVLGKAPLGTIPLAAGSHKLKITHPGYASIVQGIAIKGGAELKQSFSLQPLTGKLSVNSTPSGAQVEIDGKPMGKTPLNNLSVPMGPHVIKIKYKGYQDTVKRVSVSPQQSETISVMLRSGGSVGGTITPGPAKGPWYKSWPGWTVLGLGLAAAGVGTFFLVQSGQTHQSIQAIIQNPKDSDPSQQELTDRWNNANTEQKIGYALVGTAGGLVVVAAILFAARVGTGTQSPPATASRTLPRPIQAAQLYATP